MSEQYVTLAPVSNVHILVLLKHCFWSQSSFHSWTGQKSMDVWQGVAMDSLKFHPDLPCPTLSCPAGGPPLKWPHGRFRGGLLAKQGTCDSFLPFWTPHTVRLYKNLHQNLGLYVLFLINKNGQPLPGAKQFRRNQFSTSADFLFLLLFLKQSRCN